MLTKIKKRDGILTRFNPDKIKNAIAKALESVNLNPNISKHLSKEVVKSLNLKFTQKIPSVENVQDAVEKVLIMHGLSDAAKAYILYRQRHKELRDIKLMLGVHDKLKLGVNALQVLRVRYLKKDNMGNVIETPSEMFRRVAKAISKAEKKFGNDSKKFEEDCYNVMANLEFLPNSPTLMNAGTKKPMLSACFVLPVEDSLESIFKTLRDMALIEQVGGGVGFNFSKLRPKGDIVGSTKGVASGPVSFMRIYNMTTEVIKQGSRRRGAMMGILNVDHPDILNFVNTKQNKNMLNNFNVSVAVTDKFMRAALNNKNYRLVNPRTKKPVTNVNAKDLLDLIVTAAWKTGDPGLIFIDEINRKQPLPKIGTIESTNPCGEVPLLNYESCNLGSVNLSRMVKNGKIDWKKLKKTVRLGVQILDNIIDVNKFPLKKIGDVTKSNRKIGLGVMGLAEMLLQLKVPYDSKMALKIADKVMRFIKKEAIKKSIELGKERGNFPNFKKSKFCKKYKFMRNAALLSIAPTGTISIIAGTTSGIEPLFALAYVREVLSGTQMVEVNPFFENALKKYNLNNEKILNEILKQGSIKKMGNVPQKIKRLFMTALDIKPEWHVKMQAVFQKHVDSAVSKTVNLPPNASIEDVKKVFMLAYKLKCKGITVYRYGSKDEQVLYIGRLLKGSTEKHVKVHAEYSGGCPSIECPF